MLGSYRPCAAGNAVHGVGGIISVQELAADHKEHDPCTRCKGQCLGGHGGPHEGIHFGMQGDCPKGGQELLSEEVRAAKAASKTSAVDLNVAPVRMSSMDCSNMLPSGNDRAMMQG